MRMLSKSIGFAVFTIFVLGSCKTTGNKKSKLEGEVSGLGDKKAALGQGYETTKDSPRSMCFTGDIEWGAAQKGELKYTQDIDLNTLQNVISGGANLGIALSIFNVEGGGDVAVREASDEFSSTISLVQEIQSKRKTLKSPPTLLPEIAKLVINKDGSIKNNVRELCGNEYFSQVVYGGTLIINAKFRFSNRADKVEFKGKAGVKLAGIGEIGGFINGLNDKLKRNSSVSIWAKQIGGDVAKLSTVLNKEIVTCSLADFDKSCLPMLQGLVDYASKDFSHQFDREIAAANAPDTAAGWAGLRYISEPFAGIAVRVGEGVGQNATSVVLTPDKEINEIQLKAELEAEDGRISLYLSTQDILKGIQRANDLKNSSTTPSDQLPQIDTMLLDMETLKKILMAPDKGYNKICTGSPTLCPSLAKTYSDKFNAASAKWPKWENLGETCLTEAKLKGSKWKFKRWKASTELSNDDKAKGLTTPSVPRFEEVDIGELELVGKTTPEGDNTIGGPWAGRSKFERTWKVVNCQLQFGGAWDLPDNKKLPFPSSVFDAIETPDRMTGVFLYDLSFRHVLTRI